VRRSGSWAGVALVGMFAALASSHVDAAGRTPEVPAPSTDPAQTPTPDPVPAEAPDGDVDAAIEPLAVVAPDPATPESPVDVPALPAAVSGVVRDPAGAAVPAALVVVGGGPSAPLAAVTDATGTWTAALGAGTYSLVATAPALTDLLASEPASVTVEAGAAVVAPDLVLRARGAVVGVVSDRTGAPVADAVVSVRGVVPVTTSATGAFALSGVEPGPQTLVVTPPASSPLLPTAVDIVVPSGGTVDLPVALLLPAQVEITLAGANPATVTACAVSAPCAAPVIVTGPSPVALPPLAPGAWSLTVEATPTGLAAPVVTPAVAVDLESGQVLGCTATFTATPPAGALRCGPPPDPDADTDGDGVRDVVEAAVPGAGGAPGDGDGDGTPDATQAAVASLPGRDGGWITLRTSAGRLAGVAVDAPGPALPAEVVAPAGVLDLAVLDLPAGGSTELRLWDVGLPDPLAVWVVRAGTWEGGPPGPAVVVDGPGAVRAIVVDGGVDDPDGVVDGAVVARVALAEPAPPPPLPDPDLVIVEGDRGFTWGAVPITLASRAHWRLPVIVTFCVAPATAELGVDVVGRCSTKWFGEGVSFRAISVRVIDDLVPEPTEWFTVELVAVNGTVVDDELVVHIVDDDAPPVP
jgi:hypothetical protein